MTEMLNTLINNKWNILLPKHRAERKEWPYWEAARLQTMHDILQPQDVLLYIGAEEGDMAALCQMWGAKVCLFEPNARVWPNIKAIWDANGLEDPLMCYPGFASNETKNQGLIAKDCWPAEANGEVISDHGFKELQDPGEIPQTKIDDLNLEKVDAISIDVEGSEWEVLKGALETIKKFKPKIWISIHPEFMNRIYDQYQFDLRQWIKELGYFEQMLDYQHELHLYFHPITFEEKKEETTNAE